MRRLLESVAATWKADARKLALWVAWSWFAAVAPVRLGILPKRAGGLHWSLETACTVGKTSPQKCHWVRSAPSELLCWATGRPPGKGAPRGLPHPHSPVAALLGERTPPPRTLRDSQCLTSSLYWQNLILHRMAKGKKNIVFFWIQLRCYEVEQRGWIWFWAGTNW